MKNARCLRCGLTIMGRWKHGAPKACPACGFSGSNELLQKMATAQIQKQESIKNDSNPKRSADNKV